MRNAIDKKKNGRLGAVLVAVGTVLVMLDVRLLWLLPEWGLKLLFLL